MTDYKVKAQDIQVETLVPAEAAGKLQGESKQRARWLRWVGIGLIIFSTLLYACLPVVPFTPFEAGTKVIIAGVLVAVGEVTFWIGGVIVGAALVKKFKGWLDPRKWFRLKQR